MSTFQGQVDTVVKRLRELGELAMERPPAFPEEPPMTAGGLYEANAELILANAPTEPLAELSVEKTDPLESFAQVFATLRDDWQEHGTAIYIDVMAIPNSRVYKLRSYWMNKAVGRVGRGSLSEPETNNVPIGRVVQRRQDTARLASKLDPQEILFEVQILIHCQSTQPGREVEILRGFLTAFSQWKGANEWVVYGQPVGAGPYTIRFWATDRFRWRKRWHAFRRRTGMFWPARVNLVAAWELQAFLKPWTNLNASSAPYRSGGIVPEAPAALGEYEVTHALPEWQPPAAEEKAANGAAEPQPEPAPAAVEGGE